MTVAELIKELGKYPPGMRVVIDGYEGGICMLDDVEKINITREPVNNVWYHGEYEEVKDGEDGEAVVYFPRNE